MRSEYDDFWQPQQLYGQGLGAAAMAYANPFAETAHTAGQNVLRQWQNLGDSATTPRNKRVYQEGGSQPLVHALVNNGNQQDISSNDFQNMFKQIADRSMQSRRAIDVKHIGDLGALDTLTKLLGSADIEDANGVTNAVKYHKDLQQISELFDAKRKTQDDAELGSLNTRRAEMKQLNQSGVREYGPSAKYSPEAIDNTWRQNAAGRDTERKQFMQRNNQDTLMAYLTELRAGATQQASAAAKSAMEAMTTGQTYRAKEQELAAAPEMQKAKIEDIQAQAEERRQHHGATNDDVVSVIKSLGLKSPTSKQVQQLLPQIIEIIKMSKQPSGDKRGAAPAPFNLGVVAKPSKPGATISATVVQQYKQRFGNDVATAMKAAKADGWGGL